MKVKVDGQTWTFDDGVVLPLRHHGKIETRGWDIPTCWAQDDAGQFWKDHGHGPDLVKTTAKSLLGELDNDYEKLSMALELGIPIHDVVCTNCNGTGKIKAPKL